MIKKILLLTLLITTNTLVIFAQERTGFDWNKTFVGGSIVLGYGGGNTNSQFSIGGNPEVGYSIFKSVDLGLCGNYIYSTNSFTDGSYTDKTNITLSGLGIFTRIHITDRIFIHVQPEFNNIKYKRFIKETGFVIDEGNLKSSSFLTGVGFGTRDVGSMSFFTLILIDLQKDKYSPYRTASGDISPILRSGINFYFGRK